MKDFKHKGIRTKKVPSSNYSSIWNNLKIIRFGNPAELPPTYSEFYDVSITRKCNLECPFCYVSANKSNEHYTDICEKALQFFGKMDSNQKPYQIAIGSEGEPTIHPDFIRFMETIHSLDIIPNYTTNGITIASNTELSRQILDATEKYCAGVAVSANHFNMEIWTQWNIAVDKLLQRDVHTNLHIVIGNQKDVERFYRIADTFKDSIHTYVLLPLMKSGRSDSAMTMDIFNFLRDVYESIDFKDHIAFGAHMYPFLKCQIHDGRPIIKCSLYEPESFSKNLILSDPIRITPSSFDTQTTIYQEQFIQ